ncbi:YwqG family protein [Kerstersia similis]|uniref:YwqG family protein n=1 Tax=Kerstersia similis TaxID=206505 RepID=UPI0039EF9ED8
MNLNTLERHLDASPLLKAHKSYFLNLAQPIVAIRLGQSQGAARQSRFGGQPVVPVGFAWPEHPEGHYLFVGQINFAELPAGPDRPAELPASGLLSLFYGFDEDDAIFWRDENYLKAYYWPNTSDLHEIQAPHRWVTRSHELRFENGIDIPRHEELRDDWPVSFDEISDWFEALEESGDLPRDYLLGRPSWDSLAYDPTPNLKEHPSGSHWRSLLTLQSHEAFNWCWQDGARLMAFIEDDKLRAHDFNRLQVDCG